MLPDRCGQLPTHLETHSYFLPDCLESPYQKGPPAKLLKLQQSERANLAVPKWRSEIYVTTFENLSVQDLTYIPKIQGAVCLVAVVD